MAESGELSPLLPKQEDLNKRCVPGIWQWIIQLRTIPCQGRWGLLIVFTAHCPSFHSSYILHRLKELIASSPVLMFMKGDPEVRGFPPEQNSVRVICFPFFSSCLLHNWLSRCMFQTPRCGFSREACRILKKYDRYWFECMWRVWWWHIIAPWIMPEVLISLESLCSVKFGTFDILQDQEVSCTSWCGDLPCAAVTLAIEEMRTPYTSEREICVQKFGNAYQRKEIGKRMVHLKARLPPGSSNDSAK